MKKLVLLITLVLLAGTVFAQTYSLPAFQLNLPRDRAGFQNYVTNRALLNGTRFVAGETYRVTFRFTLNRDVSYLWWTIVDQSPAAGWWRDIINSDGRIYENLRAGQEITITETIRIGTSATNATPDANSICFFVRGGTIEPIMRFTEFAFVKQ